MKKFELISERSEAGCWAVSDLSIGDKLVIADGSVPKIEIEATSIIMEFVHHGNGVLRIYREI